MKRKNIKRTIELVLNNYDPDIFDGKKAYEKFLESRGENVVQRKKTTQQRYRTTIFVTASVVAAIIVSVVVFTNHKGDNDTVIASSDNILSYVMPDSSKIVLHPNSSISFNKSRYNNKKRDVKMVGKAYFDIIRDGNASFNLICGNAAVNVLGTTFQVEEIVSGVAIYVSSGRVRFKHKDNNDGVVLSTGMAATLARDENMAQIIEKPKPNPTVWATGVFKYTNTPIADVVEELSIYYNKTISVDNNNKFLTAEFRADDLDMVIVFIEKVLNVNITIDE